MAKFRSLKSIFDSLPQSEIEHSVSLSQDDENEGHYPPRRVQRNFARTVSMPVQIDSPSSSSSSSWTRRTRRGTIVTDDNLFIYRDAFRRMVKNCTPVDQGAAATAAAAATSPTTLPEDDSVVSTTTTNVAMTISKAQFVDLCVSALELGLSEVEVERVWRHMDEKETGQVGEEEFCDAVRNWRFLRKIAAICGGGVAVPFPVSPQYDYTQSTEVNHSNSCADDFVGEFVRERRALDKAYHSNYSRERQLWQDEVVKRVSVRIEPQAQPWVVYTCGAMGAGKGYALSYMSRLGCFPLEHIVHIDPDAFKQIMPEWNRYVEVNPLTAGTLCHKESGLLQELCQEAAMSGRQNVWVDGSLRDGAWFEQVFDSLRSRYPEYRVAIFLVQASEEVAWQRCVLRAQKSGRSVPRNLFLDSLRKPDSVLSKLTTKVDFVARINNDGSVPVLEAFESVDVSGDWTAIKKMFARMSPAAASPLSTPQSPKSPPFVTLPDLFNHHDQYPSPPSLSDKKTTASNEDGVESSRTSPSENAVSASPTASVGVSASAIAGASTGASCGGVDGLLLHPFPTPPHQHHTGLADKAVVAVAEKKETDTCDAAAAETLHASPATPATATPPPLPSSLTAPPPSCWWLRPFSDVPTPLRMPQTSLSAGEEALCPSINLGIEPLLELKLGSLRGCSFSGTSGGGRRRLSRRVPSGLFSHTHGRERGGDSSSSNDDDDDDDVSKVGDNQAGGRGSYTNNGGSSSSSSISAETHRSGDGGEWLLVGASAFPSTATNRHTYAKARRFIEDSAGAGARAAGRPLGATKEEGREEDLNDAEVEAEEVKCALPLSPGFVLPWGSDTRRKSGVPPLAHSARFVYPATTASSSFSSPCHVATTNTDDSGGRSIARCSLGSSSGAGAVANKGVSLLRFGGFAFFDFTGKLVGVSEISPAAKNSMYFIEFEKSVPLPSWVAPSLAGRWQPIEPDMRAALTSKGADSTSPSSSHSGGGGGGGGGKGSGGNGSEKGTHGDHHHRFAAFQAWVNPAEGLALASSPSLNKQPRQPQQKQKQRQQHSLGSSEIVAVAGDDGATAATLDSNEKEVVRSALQQVKQGHASSRADRRHHHRRQIVTPVRFGGLAFLTHPDPAWQPPGVGSPEEESSPSLGSSAKGNSIGPSICIYPVCSGY